MDNLNNALIDIEKFIQNIRNFMLLHNLKFNDNKTEVIIIGSHQQLECIPNTVSSNSFKCTVTMHKNDGREICLTNLIYIKTIKNF